MNANHASFCSSAGWLESLQSEVIEPLVANLDLGAEMLEIGPGPGAATEWLRHRVGRLVCLESDAAAADALRERLGGPSVEVICGDATEMTFPDESFDSIACFTMLHHVPTDEEQNRILAEALRVLRPGGVLVGSDSLASVGLHEFHADDVYNPIEPASFLTRLRTVGYSAVLVAVDWDVRFVARRPGLGDGCSARQDQDAADTSLGSARSGPRSETSRDTARERKQR